MEAVDESTVDQRGLQHLLQGCVHVHGASAEDGVRGNFTMGNNTFSFKSSALKHFIRVESGFKNGKYPKKKLAQ